MFQIAALYLGFNMCKSDKEIFVHCLQYIIEIIALIFPTYVVALE